MVNKKLSNENVNFLIDSYSAGLSATILADKFNVYPSTIVRVLRRNNILVRTYSQAATLALNEGRMKKNKIPSSLSLNEDLSYILGVLCGDGYIDYSDRRMTWQIGLDVIDIEFVQRFSKALYNFFKINPTFRIRKQRKDRWNIQYTVKLCSKEACTFINSIGLFKTRNWDIPLEIKNSGLDVKSYFLKGFFDSEGGIDRAIGRVEATSINLGGLSGVGKLLEDLGIRYTILKTEHREPNRDPKYTLRINAKNSIIDFYKSVGFTISRKQLILEGFFKKWCETK